jgi:hypothetical protein
MRLRLFLLFSFLLLFSFSLTFSQDTRQWVAHAAGTYRNSNSGAAAITVDKSGNILVTGWMTNTGTGIDIVTIKYSPDGEEKWRAYYNYATNMTDKGKAIAVDTAKNVYVTGTSAVSGSGLDYVTLKYDSSGNLLWTQPYNGPAGNGDDQPSAIAVNDSMNVFITGWSKGSGTGYDYATLKYNSAGLLLWEKRYNGPALGTFNGTDSALAMTLYRNTDLFVTGTSVDSGYDYFTIKYNPSTGDSLWGARYNGTGLRNDIARSIVRTSTGDVILTGGSQNEAGDYDYATMRYSSAGVRQWVHRYNGTASNDDQAYGLSLSSTTRVLVTGKSIQSGSFHDVTTVCYAQSNGDSNWVRAYNGTANDEDVGTAMSGTYIIGPSMGAGVGKDYALLQYTANNGNLGLQVRYNGYANDDDIPVGIVSSGNAVYVTGTSKKLKGSEILTVKYVDIDRLKYRSFTQDSLAQKGVAILPTLKPTGGNVCNEVIRLAFPKIKRGFAGYPGGLVLGNPRPDSATSYGWMRFDKGSSIAAYMPDAGDASRFDSFGTKVFVGEKKNPKRAYHDNHLAGELLALKVNIGASDAEITPPTFGDLIYDDAVLTNPYRNKTLRQIAVLADNYMTYGGKYPSVDWNLLDTVISRINHAFDDSLKIVSKDALVITGVNPVDSVWYLSPAIAPLMNPLAFELGSLDLTPENFALNQNYPNPFNPTTTIGFGLPEASLVTLKIYDILGREVATLLENEEMDEGNQELMFNAAEFSSGIYFYRIIVNDGQYQQIKKMVLMK